MKTLLALLLLIHDLSKFLNIKYFISLFILIFSFNSYSQKIDPASIAIMPIFGTDSSTDSYGETVKDLIINDLTSTEFIQIISEEDFIESDNLVELIPAFKEWKAINTQFIFSADIDNSEEGIVLRMRLIDVFSETDIKALKLTIKDESQIHRIKTLPQVRIEVNYGKLNVNYCGKDVNLVKGDHHTFYTNLSPIIKCIEKAEISVSVYDECF